MKHMVELGLRIADGFDGHAKADIIQASNGLDQQLARLGQNATPEAKKKLAQTLAKLETTIHEAVIHRSVCLPRPRTALLLRTEMTILRAGKLSPLFHEVTVT